MHLKSQTTSEVHIFIDKTDKIIQELSLYNMNARTRKENRY